MNRIFPATEREPLLVCRDLTVAFASVQGRFNAVENIDYDIDRGEVVCIVGESGCGKSLTALSLLGLLPETAFHAGGSIRFAGRSIEGFTDRQFQAIRGNHIAMIFQEPMTSLNPTLRIGRQIMEPMRLHRGLGRAAAHEQALSVLKSVGIPAPRRRMDEYPHQLSGGMRQRVMIAMAICCNPALLIADEPTTALDVTIQAQILDLLRALVLERQMAVLFITHDLGVVAEIGHRVLVMYAGRIVEAATVKALFESPLHPYTRGLMASVPRIEAREDMLHSIPGVVPGIKEMVGIGCRFASRCDRCMSICREKTPAAVPIKPDHSVACHLYAEETS